MDKSELLQLLSQDSQAKRYGAGEAIVREGEPATEGLGFILSGSARVIQTHEGQRVQVGGIQAGQFFGETALVLARPRMATVEAETPETTVLFQSPAQFRANIANNYPFLEMLVRHTIQRVEHVIGALARLDARQELSIDPSLCAKIIENRRHNLLLQEMLNHTRSTWVGKDNPVFRQDDRNDGQIYLVVKGRIGVYRDFDKQHQKLLTLEEGDMFGYSRKETASFRKYSARTEEDSARVISFDIELMERLLRMSQEQFYYFFRSIVTQLVILDDGLRMAGLARMRSPVVTETDKPLTGAVEYSEPDALEIEATPPPV